MLAGPGKLALSHRDAQVQTQGGTARLVNGTGHAIGGWGQLSCALLNEGTITAKGTDKMLSMGGATNLRTLRAEPNSTLRTSGRVDGGTIIADGTLELHAATIATDVPITGLGVIRTNPVSAIPTLEGVPIRNTTSWVSTSTRVTGPPRRQRHLWGPA